MFDPLKLIYLILLSTALHACGQPQAASQPSKEVTLPLFVVTGFASDISNVSSDSLNKLWDAKEIHVLGSCYKEAVHYFGRAGGIVCNDMDSFIRVSHNRLMLCDLEHLSPRLPAISVNGVDYFTRHSQYPLHTLSDAELPDTTAFTWLTITGVTAISRGSGLVTDQKGTDFLIAGIKDQFQHTDLLHMSNEVSFTADCQYVPKTMQFCTKCRDFDVFHKLGADIVELTGNHNRDYGRQPFIDTYNWYLQNGIQPFGGGRNPREASKPLVVSFCGSFRLAFIGYNELCPCGECADDPDEPGANRWNQEQAAKTIDSLRKAGVDYIIAAMQFGESDSYTPTPTQKKIAHWLIDTGADLVYGSQAHQIQQFEFYHGKPILHGLGNFLFDQTHRIGVRQSCFIHLIFYRGKLIQLRPVFTMMGMDRQLKPATAEEENTMRREVFNSDLIYR